MSFICYLYGGYAKIVCSKNGIYNILQRDKFLMLFPCTNIKFA